MSVGLQVLLSRRELNRLCLLLITLIPKAYARVSLCPQTHVESDRSHYSSRTIILARTGCHFSLGRAHNFEKLF